MLAKGANREKSRMFGVLDTWALVELEHGGPESAELRNLYSARLLFRFPGLSDCATRLAAAGVAAELAEWAAPTGAEAEAPFAYLVGTLKELHGGAPLSAMAPGMLYRATDLFGLAPELKQCASCSVPLPAGPGPWSAAEGGRLCSVCAKGAALRRTLSAAALQHLIDGCPCENVDTDLLTEQECFTILDEFLAYHLERRPRALELLRRRLSHPIGLA